MNTPFQLKEYFFPVVQVVAGPPVEEKVVESAESTKFNIGVHINKHIEEKTLFQLSVDIKSINHEEKWYPYKIHMTVIGIFQVDINKDDYEKLLYINGSSILYSAAREFLITITCRGPWAPVNLPTYSFLDKLKAASQTSGDHEHEQGEQG